MIEEGLDTLLRGLAAGRCRVGWRWIDVDGVPGLTTAEAHIVERAVERRQAEFATGRRLLRNLMGTDVEILRASNGAPILPPDFVGGLAHDREVVIGAVASAEAVRAVGIDIEPEQEVEEQVAEIVVRSDDVVPDPLTAFVVKEAAYKAWSVLGGDMLEHHDVNVIVEGDRYRADLRGELEVHGELGRAAGRVVALVVIPAT